VKLNSLKDLKAIRKEFSPAPEQKTTPVQRTAKTLKSTTKTARSGHLDPGQKVRLMDSNDTGTILGFKNGGYEVELDGLPVFLLESQFYPVNEEEDRKLRSSVSPRKKEAEDDPEFRVDETQDLTVDLHLERIPGNEGIPEWAALEFQLNYFRTVLRRNLKHRGKRIVFIHGVGDGKLASEIRKELDEVYALTCTYTVGEFGVTNVTVR